MDARLEMEIAGLDEFLRDYPLMAIRPSGGNDLVLKGRFDFRANAGTQGEITDSFVLTIRIPRDFPKCLPTVVETGGRIPRTGTFHVNADGTLCLGSPLRLLLQLAKNPTLPGFADLCLVPYLFAISHKLQHGGALLFDELAHGSPGMLADYVELFGLKNSAQAKSALTALGMKKRIANKRLCPCGCGIRLGKCKFNRRLAEFRVLAPRSWYKKQRQFL